MRRATDRQAFTLLEMLVAITIMGILAASLYGSLRTVFKGRDRAEAALAPMRATTIAMGMMRTDVESAMPPTGILAGAFNGVDVKGDSGRDADSMSFYSCANSPDGVTPAGDIRLVEFALTTAENETDGTLVRRITTNLLSPNVVTPVEEVLCRGVLSFNLRYYDGTTWQDSWDAASHSNTLPLAVEATLEIRPPAGASAAVTASTTTTTMLTGASGYRSTAIFAIMCAQAGTDSTQVIMPESTAP